MRTKVEVQLEVSGNFTHVMIVILRCAILHLGSSAILKPNKAKDDFAVRPIGQINLPPKVSNVPSQPAFPGSRFVTPLPSPGRPATSRFYTPPSSSGLSRSRFLTI
ncbi:hypothetical protein T10_4236 [Trichinella papuae]|uniref:Uncharacterized protein n=1 Tax=Trichinella papuae TaxID=268474 RepID=A0A0V1M3L6_9BILA|nr:hypothetical protein T10_4236 [Trichinella papuae]